jgi:hypothetical protein
VAKWNFWSTVNSNEVKVFLTLKKAFSETSSSTFATHTIRSKRISAALLGSTPGPNWQSHATKSVTIEKSGGSEIPKDPNRTRVFECKFYVFYGVEHQDRPTHKQHDTSIAKDAQNDHEAAVISDTTTNATTNL